MSEHEIDLQTRVQLLEEELRLERLVRHFQNDLVSRNTSETILAIMDDYIAQLMYSQHTVNFLINTDFVFSYQPKASLPQTIVKRAEQIMEEGQFGWALNRRRASILPSDQEESIILMPLIGIEACGIVVIFLGRKISDNDLQNIGILNIIAREAAISMENMSLIHDRAEVKRLAELNQELAAANERVSKLVHEKERVFKALEKSQLELQKKARDIENNNKTLLATNAQLKEAQSQLEEYGKTLELKVQERTRELEKSNSQLKKLSLTLHQINLKLKESDQLKNDFLSFTAHELRTPLTSIKAFTELLIIEPKAMEKKDEYLAIVKSEADRLTRLTSDLLEISKIESGKMDWDFKIYQPADIIQRAVTLNQTLAESQTIRIDSQIVENLNPIKADSDRLLQVLTNLLGNAIKFSPDNSVIRILTQKIDTDDSMITTRFPEQEPCPEGYLMIAVCDNGPGIKADDIPHVFQKFKQIRGHKGRFKGTGLGLPISREIVRAHQGEIWVESALGQGSTFIILLPLCPKETA